MREPPVREPPVGAPPVREPPVREPPEGAPPVREPPVGAPPRVEPVPLRPPVPLPAVRAPPVGAPPLREPPVREPPVGAPPLREPPAREPPPGAPPRVEPVPLRPPVPPRWPPEAPRAPPDELRPAPPPRPRSGRAPPDLGGAMRARVPARPLADGCRHAKSSFLVGEQGCPPGIPRLPRDRCLDRRRRRSPGATKPRRDEAQARRSPGATKPRRDEAQARRSPGATKRPGPTSTIGRGAPVEKIRRRPTLPGGSPPSTIGAGGLHFRVRNGNGCFPAAMATGNLWLSVVNDRQRQRRAGPSRRTPERARTIKQESKKIPSPRPISTGRLNTLPCVHLRPINLVVYQGPYPVNPVGDLISRQASRLDAFSAYPFRRSPTSHALGRTTGTRELRPSRSSRTRDSSPQISYAYGG